jgi:hypothetical protein
MRPEIDRARGVMKPLVCVLFGPPSRGPAPRPACAMGSGGYSSPGVGSGSSVRERRVAKIFARGGVTVRSTEIAPEAALATP